MKISELEKELSEIVNIIINEKKPIKYIYTIKGCRILIKELKELRKGVDKRIYFILNELQLSLFERWISGDMSDKKFAFKMKDFIERCRNNNDIEK